MNSIAKPEMTLKLILQVPSGWSMSGSGFTESCTGQCTATYQVASGDQRSIELEMQPNQSGSFVVEAQMEWWFGDDPTTLDGGAVELPLTVVPLATPVGGPTLAPQRAAPIPTSGGGDGCFSAGGSGGSGSLMLLGLLILPVVGLMARPLLSRPALPRSLAGKPLAGFYATPSRRIPVLYRVVVHIIHCNTHYFLDNRR